MGFARNGCDRPGSIVIASVVALQESIAAPGRNIYPVEATISPAKSCLSITEEMFEVQLHQARIVEIGRKVVTGPRWVSAHADNGIPNVGRQTFNMLRIPGIVVRSLTGKGEC